MGEMEEMALQWRCNSVARTWVADTAIFMPARRFSSIASLVTLPPKVALQWQQFLHKSSSATEWRRWLGGLPAKKQKKTFAPFWSKRHSPQFWIYLVLLDYTGIFSYVILCDSM